VVKCGEKSSVEMILATEFSEAIEGVLPACSFQIWWRRVSDTDEKISPNDNVLERVDAHAKQAYSAGGKVLAVQVTNPIDAGIYHLKVTATCTEHSMYILPLESAEVRCVAHLEEHAPAFLVTCYRHVPCPGLPFLRVCEEYGACLGSHTWDSSVVLLQTLGCLQAEGKLGCSLRRVALDVGAGVGVGGLGLAAMAGFQTTLISDKAELLPLMQRNIALNRCIMGEGNARKEVHAIVLDWSEPSHVRTVQTTYGPEIDLILASDVLYDLAAANYLCGVLQALARPGKGGTPIYLAQRLRDGRKDLQDLVEGGTLENWRAFSVEAVSSDAGVSVFRMMLKE